MTAKGSRETSVLPGEDVTTRVYDGFLNNDIDKKETDDDSKSKKRKRTAPKIGWGLTVKDSNKNPGDSGLPFQIVAKTAGRLTFRESTNTYFILQNLKRYSRPQVGDRIIGIVEERFGDYYRLNIFATHSANLHRLEFEGATKRNLPNLAVGALVYCRVSETDPDLNAMVSCKVALNDDGGAARKDWMTGEATYGELKDKDDDHHSTSMRVSLGLARELIHPQNLVLQALGKSMAFEIAVGVNGMAWVNSAHPEHTIIVCNAIKNSEVMTPDQTRVMVQALLKRAAAVTLS